MFTARFVHECRPAEPGGLYGLGPTTSALNLWSGREEATSVWALESRSRRSGPLDQ